MENEKLGYVKDRDQTGSQSQHCQVNYYREREYPVWHRDEAETIRQENKRDRKREWKEYQSEITKTMKGLITEETDRLREDLMKQRENF